MSTAPKSNMSSPKPRVGTTSQKSNNSSPLPKSLNSRNTSRSPKSRNSNNKSPGAGLSSSPKRVQSARKNDDSELKLSEKNDNEVDTEQNTEDESKSVSPEKAPESQLEIEEPLVNLNSLINIC